MKKNLNFLAVAALLVSVFWLGGCMLQFGNEKPAGVAGIFKSYDKGTNWLQKNLFLHSGGTGSIAGINIMSLTFDPQDNKAIYAATDANGLFYSYDSGESWMKAGPVGNGRIEAVAIDPKDKCTIFATFANTILKSTDCSRSWKEVYIDTRADKAVTALAIDPYNNSLIYAGNTAGDILLSADGGGNWQVNKRLGDRVMKLMIASNDNRVIYAPTKGQGIFKTTDAAANWTNLSDSLKNFAGALEYKNLMFDFSQPNALLLVSKYGLIRTKDGGASWEAVKLITPPSSVDIFSAALNPKNSAEIYYATATTFYKTTDGGGNWITTRLPSTAVATYLAVDPVDSNVLYMGLTNIAKK